MKSLSLDEAKCLLEKCKNSGRQVDMTRGRPSKEQLEIGMRMLESAGELDYTYAGGDARNYGDLKGVPAARELFADLFGVGKENVVVLDGSSLSIMYRLVANAMDFGIMGEKPWREQGRVKFLCPAPGYDRHFAICEEFGIEMMTVPMLADGPDMDVIERLVQSDASVKGIWCVPKYSNPTGIIFSDSTVECFASLKPAAKDFRIFWDNAYIVHSLTGEQHHLANIFDEAKKCGNDDLIYEFTSTSKITFAGSGIAALAASEKNIADFLSHLQFEMINPNKVNQVMHAAYLKNTDNIARIMGEHAALLRPKFELVDRRLFEAFGRDCPDVKWTMPLGGYFISLDVRGVAARVGELTKCAGVKFTKVGATYPYGKDPHNSNIRIAPSIPTLEELDFAMDALIAAITIALAE